MTSHESDKYDELSRALGIAVLSVIRAIADIADFKAEDHNQKLVIVNGLALITVREITDKILETSISYMSTVKEQMDEFKKELDPDAD